MKEKIVLHTTKEQRIYNPPKTGFGKTIIVWADGKAKDVIEENRDRL